MKVIKRDGRLEEFDANKIQRVCMAAGLSEEKAQSISNKVLASIDKYNEKSISSEDIAKLVIAELKEVDVYAADMFEWYQKTKEVKKGVK